MRVRHPQHPEKKDFAGPSPHDGEPRRAGASADPNDTGRTGRAAVLIGWGGSFSAFYLYLLLRIDPSLIYHTQCPEFLVDWAFLDAHLARPGGAIAYLAALLTQLCYFPWCGALILTVIAVVLCAATAWFLKSVTGKAAGVLSLVPAVFLLVLHNSYAHCMSADIGLMIAMLFVGAYAAAPLRNAVLRAVCYAGLSAGLYYLAGGAFLLFAVLCALFELARKRRMLALLCVLAAAVIPWCVGVWIAGLGPMEAYGGSLPFLHEGSPLAASLLLYLFFPIAFAVAWLRGLALDDSAPAGSVTGFARAVDTFMRTSKVRWAVGWPLLIVVAGAAVWTTYDAGAAALIPVDFAAQHKRWERVLREAREVPGYHPLVIHDVNRALCHTGRLPYDMFAHRQKANEPLLLIRDERYAGSRMIWLKQSDIHFDIGLINKSEHLACEAMEILGERPEILRRLALIYMVKDEPDAARTFLIALSKNLLHRNWAKRYLRALDEDETLAGDPFIQTMRGRMLDIDYVNRDGPLSVSDEELMLRLLAANKQNRMAFEYLMAHYLLTGQLDKIAENIGRLDDFDYEGIPRHYEEALLLRSPPVGDATLDFAGRTISPGTRMRYKQCTNKAGRCTDGNETGMREFFEAFGDTYWCYYWFGGTTLRGDVPW